MDTLFRDSTRKPLGPEYRTHEIIPKYQTILKLMKYKSELMLDIKPFYTEYDYYVLHNLNTYNTTFIFTPNKQA